MAPLQPSDFQLPLGAENGLFKPQVYASLEVFTTLSLAGSAASRVSKERIEDVPKTTEYVEAFKWAVDPTVGANAGRGRTGRIGPAFANQRAPDTLR